MEVVCIGSGNAFSQDGRGAQALLLRWAPGRATLVDVGPTILMRWPEELDFGEIEELCLTHLHGDHIAGWPFLRLRLMLLEGREAALPIWGPPGSGETLEALCELCYRELLERPGFALEFHELEVEASGPHRLGEGRSLSLEPMSHHPTSIGLRFEGEGHRLAVSGDTEWCDGLERLCDGVDLAMIECTSVEPAPGRHLSLSEIRARRDRLRAREILLVHLSDAVAADLSRDPIDGVTAAYDGLRYPLR